MWRAYQTPPSFAWAIWSEPKRERFRLPRQDAGVDADRGEDRPKFDAKGGEYMIGRQDACRLIRGSNPANCVFDRGLNVRMRCVSNVPKTNREIGGPDEDPVNALNPCDLL